MSQLSPRVSAQSLPKSVLTPTRSALAGAVALAVILPALVVLAGCASGSQGLPGGFRVTPVTSLAITPTPLNPATAGVAYTAAIPVSGGTPAYGCSAASAPVGSTNGLPQGLTITSTALGCTISGTPLNTLTGTFTIGLSVSDSSVPAQVATTTLTLVVNPAFTFLNFTLGTGEVGHPFSQTFNVMGGTGPLSACSLSPVIPGLSAAPSPTSCTISGTPTATFGPMNVTLTGMDTGNASTPKSTTMNTTMLTIVPALQVSAFTLGVGEVGSAFNLVIQTTAGTGIPPLTNCSFNPGLPAGLTVAAMGATCVVSGTPTAAFPATSLTLTATDSGSTSTAPVSAQGSDTLTILARVALAPFVLGNGEVNAAYTQAIAIQNGNAPFTCSLDPTTPLPAGLAVSTVGATCVVSGTPTAVATAAPVKINVADTPPSPNSGGGTASGMSNLTILPQVTLAAFTLGNGEVNAAYSHLGIPISNGNPPYVSCTFASAAPAGLTVAINAGKTACDVTGTPTAVFAPATVSITVTDTPPSASSVAGTNTTISSANIQIFPQIAIPNPFTLGNGEVNAAYSNTTPITITPGNPAATTYTCAYTTAAPAGFAPAAWNGSLGAAAACRVTGTPTATFLGTVSIQVTESPAPSADSAAGTFTATSTNFQILPALAIPNPFTLGNGEVNAAYANTNPISITGGNPATAGYTCVYAGASPAGLNTTWNGTTGGGAACTVSGTPTAVFGPGTVSIQVTETTPPSADSAAGVFTGTSTTFQIFPAIQLPANFPLGNGEVNAFYANFTPISITGGNPAATSYTCVFNGASPTGLNAAWNATTGVGAACTVSGVPSATFGPASVMVKVTEFPAPSADSAAGNFTSTSTSFQIFPQLTVSTPTLRDGERLSGYQNQIPITITGGNPGTYSCSFQTPVSGLTVSAAGATCVVKGDTVMAGVNVASMTFGPGTATVQVTDVAPSADSQPGSAMATSGTFQIFSEVTFASFVLGNGVQGFPFAETNKPAFVNGNQPFTCAQDAALPLPAGLTTTWTAGQVCDVTGNPTTTFGPGSVALHVTDTPRSPDQTTASTAMADSQNNFTIFPPLTVVIPPLVPNGLNNVPYPGITFHATGGLSNGSNVMWTPPGGTTAHCTPPNGPAPLTGLPTGLTLNTSTGALTGKPTAPAAYNFEVCVEDNAGAQTTSTMPVGVNSTPVMIKILGRLAFASAGNTVQVIDTSTNAFVTSIALPGAAVAQGIALTADGATAYVADSGNNSVDIIDAVSFAVTSVPLPGTCGNAQFLATTADPTQPGHDRLYVTCVGGSNDIVVFNTANPAAPTQIADFILGFPIRGVAISGDNSIAMVLVSGVCTGAGYWRFDNTQTPLGGPNGICLAGTGLPTDVAIAPNNGNFYAYVSRAASVDVFNLSVAVSPTPLAASIGTPAPADAVSVDPLQSHVFATVPGAQQFVVLDNSVVNPTGTLFSLPVSAAADSAGGVTIAPNDTNMFAFQAYFTVQGATRVDVVNDNASPPFATDFVPGPGTNPITGLANPGGRIATIPIPAAGLGFITMTLPDAVTARTYDLFAVIRSGKAPFTCSAMNLPAGLSVAFNTVPGGAFANKPACEVSGTAPAAGTSSFSLTVMDSETTPQTASTGFSLTIRPEFAFNAATPLPNGVVGRTYGAPFATSPVQTTSVSTSAGNAPLTMCTLTGTGGNASLATAVAAGTGCALNSSSANLVAAETDNLLFRATDTPITDGLTGVQAVPSNTIAAGGTVALVVSPALAFTSVLTLPPWTVNATNPYPTQTVVTSGGIQASLTCGPMAIYPGLTVTTAAPNCVIAGDPTSPTAGTLLMVSAMDNGNTAVPPSVAINSNASSLVVNGQAALTTLQASFTDAVSTTDGAGATGTSRNYSVNVMAGMAGNTGTGTLTLGSTSLNSGNCAGLTLTSTPAASTVTGTVSGVPTANVPTLTPLSCSFSLTVTDTTNTTTSMNYTINIDPPLRLSFAPNSGFGVGVVGRAFSQALTATGGLYVAGSTVLQTCAVPGTPATLTTSTFVAGAGATCPVTGTPAAPFSSGSYTVTVMDGTSTAVSTAGTATASSALTINPELQIQLLVNGSPATNPPNGLVNTPYPQSPTTVTFTQVAGTGDGTAVAWVQAGATGTVCTAPSGTMPTNINIAGSTGVLSGTPTAASATDSDFSFNVCVEDGATTSTAGGSFTTASPYLLNVMNAFAYAAAAGTNTIEVFTTSRSSTTPNMLVTSIKTGGGTPGTSTPVGVAVTPNGRFAIVSEQGPDQVDVVDTITNTLIAGSPFALPGANHCGAPTGVAVDAKFVYLACTDTGGTNVEEVMVLDTVMLTGGTLSVVTEIPTTAGSTPDSIAFNTAGTRAYVTLAGKDSIMILNTTTTPPAPIAAGTPAGVFALPATSVGPRGIAVLQNTASGTKDYAFVAKQMGGTGSISMSSKTAANAASCTNNNAANDTLNCAFTVAANQTAIAFVSFPTGASVNTITDDGGNTYSELTGCSNDNGTTVALQCFITPAGKSKAATTLTVTLSANGRFVVNGAVYNGVAAIGHTNANPQTAGATTLTVATTTQDNNNVCVAGFTANTAVTFSGGGLETSNSFAGGGGAAGAIYDQTQATPTTCTVNATISASHSYAAGVVELRSVSPAVDVVDVTSDPTTTLTIVTSIPEPANSAPFGLAGVTATPSPRAYVVLANANQFDVLDNTVATPASIAGGPFNLPDPGAAATAVSPIAVAIPPSTNTPVQAYITLAGARAAAVIDNNATPTKNASSPLQLTTGSQPGRVAAIPIPR